MLQETINVKINLISQFVIHYVIHNDLTYH